MPITTAKELIDAVMEAVPNITMLPRVQRVAWFPTVGAGPTAFKSGEEVPIDPSSLVFSIFHDDEVIRIYTLGKAAPTPKPDGWVAQPPTRYTLTKAAPTSVAEIMSLDTMAEEMINEWTNVESSMSSAEAEREAVIAWVASFGDEPISSSTLIQDLRDEVHLESDDDEDDDIDEPEVGVGVPPVVAAPVVTIAPAPPIAPPPVVAS